MDCTNVFYSKNTLTVPICKSWRIRLHTFPGSFRLQKMFSVIAFSLIILSSLLWMSTICVQWFVISPNHRFILSSWQRNNTPVFILPSVRLPSFQSRFQSQFVFSDMFACRQFWEGDFDGEYLLTGNSSRDEIWWGVGVRSKESVCLILEPD